MSKRKKKYEYKGTYYMSQQDLEEMIEDEVYEEFKDVDRAEYELEQRFENEVTEEDDFSTLHKLLYGNDKASEQDKREVKVGLIILFVCVLVLAFIF